ncbi:MAG: trypsin-like peptidase domain-containing protein [Myxococcaceae bacterium]|nr:trypsin-like peptidase domain-containing protein [Myxococcaceae bacterium]
MRVSVLTAALVLSGCERPRPVEIVQGSAPVAVEARPGAPDASVPGFAPPGSLAPLVKAVRSSVLNLRTQNGGSSRTLGSGFLITADGLAITNHHVIQRAESIRARLFDGREVSAKVVGVDPATDLAVLQLERQGDRSLPRVAWGDSDTLQVGDWVLGIGNPFGLDTSVTYGIVSARERAIGLGPYDDFIQLSALINPGNSGGPLFDMHGRVVGVTTAVVAQGQGIGFAVPINLVKALLPNLLDDGQVERGWLGATVRDVVGSPEPAAEVADLADDGPAERAGLKVGDRVTALSGKPANTFQQLSRLLSALPPGAVVVMSVVRDGEALEITATLGTRPERPSPLPGANHLETLGVVMRELPNEPGLLIEKVDPQGPAEHGGLQSGDVLLRVNGQKVERFADLVDALTLGKSGQPALLNFKRGKEALSVAVRPR